MKDDHMGSSDSSAGSDADQTNVALVTGANKGIGYETARQLGEHGMTVLASARHEQRGEKAAKALQEDGIDARFLQLDVTDETTIEAAAQRIEDEFGRLDVLVNNAGHSSLANTHSNTEQLRFTGELRRNTFDTGQKQGFQTPWTAHSQ